MPTPEMAQRMSVGFLDRRPQGTHGFELLGEYAEGRRGLGFVGGPLLGHLGIHDGSVLDDLHDRPDPGHDAAAVADSTAPALCGGPALFAPPLTRDVRARRSVRRRRPLPRRRPVSARCACCRSGK